MDRQDKQLILELYRHDFRAFIEFAFPLAFPGKEFIDGWHLDVLADRLMQCGAGGTPLLLINMPPRYLKSFVCSVCWPLFVLARRPDQRVLGIAGTRELASELVELRERLLGSKRFQEVFPHMKTQSITGGWRFRNGSQLVQSTRSKSQLGRGADIIIIDDPQPVAEVSKEKKRDELNRWFDAEIRTRLNSRKTASVIIVMQRLHSDDLCGHIWESRMEFDELEIPAIANKDLRFELSDGSDRFFAAGTALCPEIADLGGLAERLFEMNGCDFLSQYLQAPGAYLGRELIRAPRWPRVPMDWKPGEPHIQGTKRMWISARQQILWDYFGEPNPYDLGREMTEKEWWAKFKIQQTELIEWCKSGAKGVPPGVRRQAEWEKAWAAQRAC